MHHQTTTLTTQLALGRENLETNTRTASLDSTASFTGKQEKDGQLMEFEDKISFSESEWEVFNLRNIQK